MNQLKPLRTRYGQCYQSLTLAMLKLNRTCVQCSRLGKVTLTGILTLVCAMFSFTNVVHAQTTLAEWTYEPLQGTSASPTPNAGIYSVTATSSIVGAMSGPGTATGSALGCLQNTGTTAWAIGTANPGTSNESSGAEFRFSTVGYENIKFSYDQRFSNTAVRTVRVQYTLDGSSWNNFTIDTLVNYTSGCTNRGAVDNGRIDIGTPVGTNTSDAWSRRNIDFSSITAANNNPNFGIRIVAAHYSTTGQFRQSNNVGAVASAGTWRFDNVTCSGTAIVTSTPSIVITNTGGGNAVTEGGAADTFSVVLGAAPNADVVLTGSPDAQVNITPAVLTFNSSNWNTPQTVIVSAVDDIISEGNHTGSISYSVLSLDPSYNNISVAPVSVTVTDNDLLHTVAFVRADTTVSENATSVKIWLKVTTAGNTSGSVDLLISSASNATNNTDYSVTSGTLNIPANAVLNQIFDFDVTIIDDANAESDEYIICKLNNAIGLNINTGIQQHTLYIKDNDKAAPVASNQLNMSFVSSFSNGAAGTNSLEISAYDSASKRIFVANSVGNKLDIINFANPSAPVLISSINLSVAPFNGSINSVAVYNGTVALALEGLTDKQANGKVVFTDINGTYISEVAAGAMPDMITFNHAGTKVYTANEGEPNSAYTNDPVGSITVVDISGGVAAPSATNIDFTAYNGQEATLRAQGIRIYGVTQPGSVPSTAAQDFEPEYITISDDDSKAWVTLQENNALVELDLTSNTIVKLIPLGYKDHNDVNNPFDVSDQTFGINLSNFNVKGMYEPDAIAQYTSGGTVYLLTANEGDARAYSGLNEETRVGSLNLDLTAYPNASEFKDNRVLGRLTVTNKLGDTDNDGDIDQIYCLGGRSFSIWNPAAVTPLVYDSKDDLERITSTDAAYSQFFNMSNTISNTSIKNRSDDKGPEPEGIVVGNIGGINYAFVSLERTGGVMIYDITNPASPVYVTYANSRTTTGGDRGAEGIIFIPSSKSPNGKNLVLLSNEISSTLSVFEINPCTAPGIATISNVGSTSVCVGSFVKLYNTDNNATYTRKWLKDGVAITGATDSVYNATASGLYSLVTFNSTGCVDTSAVIAVTTTPYTSNTTIASNCDSYTWSVDNMMYTQSGTYTNINGCHTEILDLTITPSTSNTTVASNCDSYTWSVNNMMYTQSGTYTNVNGCHTEILDLTITPSTSNTTVASNCDSYTWSVNNMIYTQSGTYTNVNGCHTEILDLTITPTGTNTTVINSCGSYTWAVNNLMYSQSGTYSQVTGCSTEILVLTVNPLPTVTASDISACAGQSVNLIGNPSGGIYSVANPYMGPSTTFTYTYTDANGCTATSAPANIYITSAPPVTGLNMTNIGGSTATINWNSVPGLIWYEVRYRPLGASTWIGGGTQAAPTSFKNITGLQAATAYEIEVRGFCTSNANQPGPWSTTLIFNTALACPTPSNLSTINVTSNLATLVWSAVPNANYYQIRYRTQNGPGAWISGTASGSATSKNLNGLVAGTTYEWQIRAICNPSPFSTGSWSPLSDFSTRNQKLKAEDLSTIEQNMIRLYPNPTRGIVYLDIVALESQESLIRIMDMSGRVVHTTQSHLDAGSHTISLNVESLAEGLYQVHVMVNEKQVLSTKFSKIQ